MVKESKFVKRIKKLEREGYEIDGAIIAFTTDNSQGTFTMCEDGTMLRINEEIKIQLDLLKEKRKSIIQKETKQALGSAKTETPSYII